MSDESFAVAVIGGATAGAEAADIFAKQGILTVVFEQNARPYGKVEDGLPRWHVGLRAKEYATIDQKLGQALVHFVPNTKVGRDVSLRELCDVWGFHSVVLANGAWRDRPLAVPDAEKYVGKGLVYQNPFIQWFNHRHEAGYRGPVFEALDDTIVVGGGLASIDVVKAINLELASNALRQRKGVEIDLEELEVEGIPKALAAHGLTWEGLGFKGATLFYRRRVEDMPLVSLPDDANEKVRAKIEKTRAHMLEKAVSKYLFHVRPLRAPLALLIENERVVGMRFAVTRMEGGKLVTTDETEEVRGSQVISSIGSIPEALEGVPQKGELYAYSDWDLGRLPDYPTLFSAGNVVTGKGNIVDSRKHARFVGQHVRDEYLALAKDIRTHTPLSPAAREALLKRIRARQEKVAYRGYAEWIKAARPPEFI
jgi:NADPH-dependent glutamate synthase beta subunit-like oxidoreductase